LQCAGTARARGGHDRGAVQVAQVAELIDHVDCRLRPKELARGGAGGRLSIHGQGLGRAGYLVQQSKCGEIVLNTGNNGRAAILEPAANVFGARHIGAVERLDLNAGDGQCV
jgi:hypothetical protein